MTPYIEKAEELFPGACSFSLVDILKKTEEESELLKSLGIGPIELPDGKKI